MKCPQPASLGTRWLKRSGPHSRFLTIAIAALLLRGISAAQGTATGTIAPPEAVGYKLVFSDDFDTLDLSPDGRGSSKWYQGVWFIHTHSPRSNFSVSKSQLSLVWRAGQHSNDTSIVTMSHDNLHGKTWRYGYFEMRAKWDVVKGAWPAFWLIALQNAKGQDVHDGVQESGELDIFEGQGAEPRTFYGTIHDWINKRNIPGKKNNFLLSDDTDLSQFHTYGVLWVPGQVTWYLDDHPLHHEPTPAVFDRQDYYLVLGMQQGSNWHYGDTEGLNVEKLSLTVDWVRVWQK